MCLHKTIKRRLIYKLHDHGIIIPYDRVLEITAQLREAMVNQYVEDVSVGQRLLLKAT